MSASSTVHGRSSDDDLDLVDKLLNETGCAALHYKVQDCYADFKDWRKCQKEVKEFQTCIKTHELQKKKNKNM